MVSLDRQLSDSPAMSMGLVEIFTDTAGTNIEFVHRRNGSKVVVIWLSAFTKGPIMGKYTKVSPRFHGFKISSSIRDLDWILIRDNAGLTGDGTYYGGDSKNLFIEHAVRELITHKQSEYRTEDQEIEFVLMGSSMGGYGAIKLAILTSVKQVFVYSPHLDMGIAMNHCGRGPWITHCLSGKDSEEDKKYLRRLQDVVEGSESLPRLVMQVSRNDSYVYPEQVVPFQSLYQKHGGTIELDLREGGGHGSVNAPDAYIEAVVRGLGHQEEINYDELRNLPPRLLSRQEKIESSLQRIENRIFSVMRIIRVRT